MRQPIAPQRDRRPSASRGSPAQTVIAVGLMAGAVALLIGLGTWALTSLSELPAGTAKEAFSPDTTAARIRADPEPAAPPDRAPAPPPAAGAEIEASDGIRYVEGAGIIATRIEGPLTREESTVAVPEPEAEPGGPKPTLYRLVVIEDADTVNLRTHTVQLAHVAGPAADETCTNSAGAPWPCGMRARTALRRLVRSRALECLDLPAAEGAPPQATCAAAGTDLSTWLVEQGWAQPTDDAPEALRKLAAEAEAAGRGVHDPAGR